VYDRLVVQEDLLAQATTRVFRPQEVAVSDSLMIQHLVLGHIPINHNRRALDGQLMEGIASRKLRRICAQRYGSIGQHDLRSLHQSLCY